MPRTRVAIETETVTVRMPKTLVTRIEDCSKESGLSVSELIRRSVEGTLQRWEEKSQKVD
jgi:Arc/MetJ-type ribon-helix-helix transcriptional regulator